MLNIFIYIGLSAAISSFIANIAFIIYLVVKSWNSNKTMRNLKKKEKVALKDRIKLLKKTYSDSKKGLK
ncbi:MAG: hypothetical protein KBS35_03240 [Mycoplasma sp.]|nr:hypothetical protein [Candidatus Hennigella equi]